MAAASIPLPCTPLSGQRDAMLQGFDTTAGAMATAEAWKVTTVMTSPAEFEDTTPFIPPAAAACAKSGAFSRAASQVASRREMR